ncbi:TNT domain-containing protein [Ruania zhangjianzhongii]|uniref:TNT domain-containing protein n=1 Tax=Ruania zhangjianzhongii TaxID=2603206 RepID=UPI0011C73783|nr:TNT domain-containing protein [Ruania zhangjianzhongii]
MDLGAQSELLTRISRALAGSVTGAWQHLELQWSQASTQHSGRLLLVRADAATWEQVPDEATRMLIDLRAQMAEPGTGAWFLITHTVTAAGEATTRYEYERRPYWNSPEASMLVAPHAPPVPTDAQWQADLRRFGRDRQHAVHWLAPEEFEGEAAGQLRTGLDQLGHPRGGVVLPGDPAEQAFEGTVEVVRYGPRHYGVQVADYGQHVLLGEYETERAACDVAWQYLSAPMPPPVPVAAGELQARLAAAADNLAELTSRVTAAGPGGMITNLATGLPYDRLGTVDGLYFYVWNTPWQQRSLPPSAWGPGAAQVTFVAAQAVEVQAEIVPGWFDQPGGAVRFHVEAPARGVRELVRSGVLRPVIVTG